MNQSLKSTNMEEKFIINSYKITNNLLEHDSLEIYEERKMNDIKIFLPDSKNLRRLKNSDIEYNKNNSEYIYIESEKDVVNMINSSDKNLFVHKYEDNSDLITEKTAEGDDNCLNSLFDKIESDVLINNLVYTT